MTITTTEPLEELALDAARQLEGAPAGTIVRWAYETFGDKFAVTASMADGVLSHVAAQAVPGIKVLFLDTGYHFAETLGTRDAIAAAYNIDVENVTHPMRVPEHEAEYGKLYETDPDLCCAIRKVWPLDRALAPYEAWAGGVRRAESPTRADTPVVAWDPKRRKVKVNPLATWTDDDVEAYIAKHDILVNPLKQVGYLSIGCEPCTRPVAPGEDPRAGRWAGHTKTECGINI
ncbi:phosphoadenylyl-sulfate reductase [Actinobacteria bacterium YIM 96077]|uniref:Adenosine 5'-phosphosulfate reductase n=1 Tax=Phytoactinopolyspora halophila TaxID=1981511 RepID=A0A329R305_9ACTN|nr:phosphoadenylyl-sulfate reductase [Phytoactinopolyspora halophila]AYY13387.1 phosphoadenylyl-sulfate reductase [Actinobacteria bacterium YIM 96077]RAW17378.1 phosphoadenylyl-sulfate reductase [Phytoactinopolyspora halophila]